MIKTHSLFDPVVIARVRAEREARASFFEEARSAIDSATKPDAKTLASAILRAGRLRRAEIVDDRLLPKRGSVAWQILNAARKRDNLPELE